MTEQLESIESLYEKVQQVPLIPVGEVEYLPFLTGWIEFLERMYETRS